MKILIVVDMQHDFVDGALGTAEAKEIVPSVLAKVKGYEGEVIFTKDTHGENYLDTREGKFLPVTHCIKGTAGWELLEELDGFCREKKCKVYEKDTFGSLKLAHDLARRNAEGGMENEGIEEIELIGLCTDICVVSNALLLKAAMPEMDIVVDASCCAGVTKEAHDAALCTMKSCQIQIH